MVKKSISKNRRRIVAERANRCCEYCQSQEDFASQGFTIEHINPKSKLGSDKLDNLALACQGCNGRKYNKIEGIDPVSKKIVALFHPREQVWTDHFAWSDDCRNMLGLTAIGRTTIVTLDLNRKRMQNQRVLYYAAAKHPPRHTLKQLKK